jgi:hypothetical protein
MSAFVISAAHMDRVVSGLIGRDCFGQIVPQFHGAYTADATYSTCKASTIGRRLYSMNIEAVTCRYPAAADRPADMPGPANAHRLPTGYAYAGRLCGAPRTLAELVDAYKAIQSLLYQCSEGNVPDHADFQELTAAAGAIAERIIQALPQYKDATWA